MYRKISKHISIILIFLFITSIVSPSSVFAAITIDRQTTQDSDKSNKPQRKKEHTRIQEMKEKRDQLTKYYINSDDSITAESSINSRHYKDNNGQWQDISNRIISSNEPGFAYSNEANSFYTHFAKNSASESLATLKVDNNEKITWGMEDVSHVDATADTYSVTYKDIIPSVDLQYLPFSDGLKENIILKTSATPNTFKFSLKADKLKLLEQKDGTIAVQDSKSEETKFIIPKPYMIDSKNQLSTNVTMKLETLEKKDTYRLTITADSKWLSDPARSYPVTIDPNYTTQNWYTQTTSGITDTFIAEGQPTLQYYNNTFMISGFDSNLGRTRSLVKFSPSLPAGAIVTDAVLSLYKYTTTSASSETLLARRITSSWPNTVSWSTQPTVDTTYDQTEASTVDVSGSYTGWVNFNVWAMVKGWINGGLPNYGFMINHNNEGHDEFFYYSSESSTGKGPFLSLTYITDELGVNPYWGYANTEIGSTNTFNGNFLTSTTDFSLPGRGIPISVTRTYNSRGTESGIFGQKWFSNIDMQLQFFNWGAVLIDPTGAERPFMLKSDGKTYAIPDNYPVQLYKDTSSGTTLYRVQQANSETGTYQSMLPSLTFNSNGKLIQLDDGKGNQTNISWGTSSIVITDASSRTVTLSLNADGTVSQILTSAEPGVIKTSYTYSSGYLSSVNYNNGTYPASNINYEWNNNLLRSVTDKNGNKNYINYNNNNQVISVGNTNVISNPSFEASPDNNSLDNWTAVPSTSDNGYIRQTSTMNKLSKFGRNSLDINSTFKAGATGNIFIFATQQVPVKPGTSYNLSSYIKTYQLGGSSTPNIAASEAFLNIEQLDSNGNHLSWIDNRSSGISGTTDWTRSFLNVTTGTNTSYIKVYLEVQHDSTHFGGDAYFDGVQLELGSNSTTFEGHTDFRYGTDSGAAEATWVTSPAGELLEYKNDGYGTPISVIRDPRDSNAKSVTNLSWDASDHLRSITTPEQVNSNSGKKYSYGYDPLGNIISDTDPLNRSTSMNYYYNHLSSLTEADGSTIKNVWNPVNLNLDTAIDQTLNSKAYTYDSGNLIAESNLLGIADNRVINSAFEKFDTSKQPSSWTSYSPSGTVVNKVEYLQDAPYGGSNVLHINAGSNNNAYQKTGYITLNNGQTTTDYFTVSAYTKLNGNSTVTTNGACINVYWYGATYNDLRTDILFKVKSSDWNHYVTTIQPPSGAAYAKVMAITYGNYDGYFDNIQFEKSQFARGYNFIEDSSFERSAPQWSGYDSNSTVINDTNAYTGNCDAQVNLSTVGNSYFQTIPINVSSGQSYTLIGMLKIANVVTGVGSGGARLHVYFYDSFNNQINDYATQQITGTTSWTRYVLPFTVPQNSVTMRVKLELMNARGTANFDDIRLSFGKLAATSSYDSNKNYISSTTDQLGNTVNFQTNAYGQNTKITSPGNQFVTFSYDGQGHLREVMDNSGSGTTYDLDQNGNILSTSLLSGILKSYDNMTFTYDRHNNLTSFKDGNNNVTNFSYDEDGRLVTKTNPNGTTINIGYDNYGNGNQLSLSTGESYNYGYDLEGRLTQASVANGGRINYSYNEVGDLTGYTERDGNNNLITNITSTSYSILDQLLGFNLAYKNNTSIAFSYDYNKAGFVNSITGNGKKFNFYYDEANNPISIENPNNTKDKYDYNEADQITGTKVVDNNESVKLYNKYSYNSDGKLTQVTGNISANYTYNSISEKLNRLTKATINDGVNSYTFNYFYDPAGNILTMDTPSGTTTPNHLTFTYDADNRITNSGFTYDSNGNLKTAVINGKTYGYNYDAANRLAAVKDAQGNTIASYTYGADGSRLTKTVNGVTTTYHYFNGQLLYETLSSDPSNVIHALYIRSPQGALEAVSLNYTIGSSSNSYYYYHYNAHGDVVAVTDGNGNIYRQYVYDPYGNVISVKDGNGTAVDINNDPGFNNAYTYAGYRYDQESGLYFLNARYYAAATGRFLTKDGLVSIKLPQSLNQYAYAIGDPINHIDPSGHESTVIAIQQAKIVVGIMVGYEVAKDLMSAGYDAISSKIKSLIYSAEVERNDVGSSENTVEDSGAVVSETDDADEPSSNTISGGTGTGTGNANKNNYRKIFLKRNPNLPKGYQVHHTLPQKYEPILKGINIHEVDYLKGVNASTHRKITAEWMKWDKALGRKPTAQDVIDFAKEIDIKYNEHWFNK